MSAAPNEPIHRPESNRLRIKSARHLSALRRPGRGFWKGLEFSAALVIAAALLMSGLAHLSNPYYFLSTIYQYRLTGPTVTLIMAVVLPFLQLVLSACFLGRICLPGAYLLSVALFGCYATAQWAVIQGGRTIECGCFGAGHAEPVDGYTLMRVALLLGVTLLGAGCMLSLRSTASVESGELTQS